MATSPEQSDRAAAPSDLLPLERLEPYLTEHGVGAGPIAWERIGEGHSNITYRIERGGRSWVLRRPPRGPLPPSAHDVLREHRLLDALRETEVRTPVPVLACDDESVIGAPFYVMEYVEGDVITEALPPQLESPAECARIGDELVQALAEIHSVDWRACGLEGFGKPTGYLERQLRRFGGLWEHNKTRDLPVVEEVGTWLAANLPESPPATVVHGDYRLGNTMFGHEAPARLVAIFDWELATIGDPLADLGYLTVTWSEPGEQSKTMFDVWKVTQAPGFASRVELVEHYERLTGRSMSALRWYQTLALWKAAVFMEGNYKRSLAGTTDDPFLALFDEGVPALAERALEVSRS